MNRIIWVVGTPNGGTSCIAGMLYHLGVDMGQVSEAPTTREYPVFEDQRLRRHSAKRFREYIGMRLVEADGKRAGVKCCSWFWMEDPHPETLPLDVVAIHRPLEHSIRSSLRRNSAPNKTLAAQKAIVKRAGDIGRAWVAKELLLDIHRPVISLKFQQVLDDPVRTAQMLDSKLRLDARGSQIKAAYNFVNSALVHIR